MRDVEVRESGPGAGIRLGQFLKLAGLADSGSQARALLEQGAVEVNNALERRRGRQLSVGDVVEVGGEVVRVAAGP